MKILDQSASGAETKLKTEISPKSARYEVDKLKNRRTHFSCSWSGHGQPRAATSAATRVWILDTCYRDYLIDKSRSVD